MFTTQYLTQYKSRFVEVVALRDECGTIVVKRKVLDDIARVHIPIEVIGCLGYPPPKTQVYNGGFPPPHTSTKRNSSFEGKLCDSSDPNFTPCISAVTILILGLDPV